MSLFGGIELPGRPDLENIRKLDLLPARSILEMQQYGFAVDLDQFSKVSKILSSEMDELRAEICATIPEHKLDEFIARSNLDSDDELEDGWHPMNVDSNQQLAKLMFEVLGIGSGRQLKRTKGGNQISTGRRQLEQLKREHPVVSSTLAYRELAKLKNTYADTIPIIAKRHPKGRCWCGLEHWVETMRVHSQILSTRTATGRYASKKINQQNLPVRSEYGRAIRAGFIASPGTELVSCDFSQIEMRMLAFLAHVKHMIQIFKEGKDVHTQTAMRAFDLPEDRIDKLVHRTPAKNVSFGIVYNESALGLYEQLLSDTYGRQGIPVPDWLTLEWCESFLKKWFKIYPEVKSYMEEQNYRAVRYGYVWDLFGRVRRIPEAKSVHDRVVASGFREAGNMPIQSTAAGLNKLALAEVQDWIETEVRPSGVWCRPLITVHDEGIWEVEEGYGECFKEVVEGVFSRVLTDHDTGQEYCSVPILADGKVSARWEK